MRFNGIEGRNCASRAGVALSSLVIAMAATSAAQAQSAAQMGEQPGYARQVDAAVPQEETSEEIVVTGTILRGAAPVGSSLISVGEERIRSQGATTSNELLATVPQVTNLFNTVPSSRLTVAVNQIQIVRPNLRNLTPETGSASSTLVLVDGHRIAGVGVTQSAVDPDLIPTAAIERVEVVTDGGSATYGADAVGGVINFITRKRFDGLRADARYGFADDYHSLDASLIAGKDWGSGSLFAAYTYARNDAIFGRDRDFIRSLDFRTAAATPTGRQCEPGNVVLGGVNYALPSLAPATFNACDPSDDQSFMPRTKRHGAIAGLHQQLNDAIVVDLRAFYGERKSLSLGPLRGTANVTRTNAFYRPIAANPTGTQSVQFSFASVLGAESAPSASNFREWGVNAELAADLTSNWQLRTLFNYSRSVSAYSIVGLNPTLLAAAGNAANPSAAVNFYDPGATPNLDVIRTIANNEIAGQGNDALFNLRAIVDGRLGHLPGGDVRPAFGYEYVHEGFRQRIANNTPRGAISAVPLLGYGRRVHSLFGELQVPLFGEDNRTPGIYALVVNGSVRHDRFSDFGNTTNPKIGVNYQPVDWITFRGNYSTSFNAPTPVDQLGSLANRFQVFPLAVGVRPGDTPPPVGSVLSLALLGSNPDLQPQTARTWSVGIDLDPPFVPGFRASVSYYNVAFKGLLGSPPAQDPATLFAAFSDILILTPTPAQLQALAPLAANGPAVIAQLLVPGSLPVFSFLDFRLNNFGNLNVEGLDFALNYRRSTSFGGVDASISGNYQLKREQQVRAGAPIVDVLAFNTPRLALQAQLGADIGKFRAQATLNHSSGYDITPLATVPVQNRVAAFDTVNLFFKYDVSGEARIFRDLSLTLHIGNVFDQDPPILRRNGTSENGFANGFTLGRMFQFGVSKKF